MNIDGHLIEVGRVKELLEIIRQKEEKIAWWEKKYDEERESRARWRKMVGILWDRRHAQWPI